MSGSGDTRGPDAGDGLQPPVNGRPGGALGDTGRVARISSDGLPLPVDDPLSSLHPSAKVILDAAREILAEAGFAALSLQTIADRAGMNKAAVHYHFGSKDGLIIAVVDALIHDECLELVRETRSLTGEQKLRAYIRGILRMVNDTRSFQDYYEVLPYILRNPTLRARMTDLYRWYFVWTVSCVGFEDVTDDPEITRAFAQLVVAVSDGLALQKLLNSDSFPAEHSYALLESLLYDVLTGRARVDRHSDTT